LSSIAGKCHDVGSEARSLLGIVGTKNRSAYPTTGLVQKIDLGMDDFDVGRTRLSRSGPLMVLSMEITLDQWFSGSQQQQISRHNFPGC
jgi:hypothetical protein